MVRNRIREISDDARAAMTPHARAWADLALDGSGTDFAEWEAGARQLYQYAGIPWPQGRVLRLPSPLALAQSLLAARIREEPGNADGAVAEVLRRLSIERVHRNIERSCFPSVLGAVQGGVYGPTEAAVAGGAVTRAVAGALDDRTAVALAGVRDAAQAAANRIRGWSARSGRRRSYTRRAVPTQSWMLHLGGQWDAPWSAYTSFMAGICMREAGTAGEAGWMRRGQAVARTVAAGWWWPHLDFVLVSERPRVYREDVAADAAPGRLHRADGPALVFADGWGLYFWRGTLVPAWVVDNPTVHAIAGEPNVEIRRCAIEALGWDRYVREARLTLVDTCRDPGNPGHDLRLYDVPGTGWNDHMRVLLAVNGSTERDGTRRRYGIAVPADMDSCLGAAAWTYGLRGDQYAQLARRT